MNTDVYLMNQCTTSGVHKVTPHERYYEKKPDLSHNWIFDSIAYVHIPDEKRQKLDPKSEKCILIGYSLEQKGYKCYNPSVEYQCIMDVFTLSSWIAQVRAICVNSLKGSCPK